MKNSTDGKRPEVLLFSCVTANPNTKFFSSIYIESVTRLQSLNSEVLQLLTPHLLEWLQDTNWPVASPTRDLLLPLDIELVPYIQKILGDQKRINQGVDRTSTESKS
ncbi:DUF5071 domain-containing protein [Paenibacillus tepidiphilus]|uniref:DUF5071 domain-containing protein n=1 Tax=Paenibacillus tepidiphilus TaxID=2608683 RepID=UPI00123C561C